MTAKQTGKLTGKHARVLPATKVMIDGKPATPQQIEGLNTPWSHVNRDRTGLSMPVLHEMNVGLVGQAILRWGIIRQKTDDNERDEIVAVLQSYGLRVDMVVRGWANASVDMSVDAA